MNVAGRRRSLVFPREHGAWGILLVPLVTGASAGLLAGGRAGPLAPLSIAVLALFWLRTPVESWMGTAPVRVRTGSELELVRNAAVALAAACGWSVPARAASPLGRSVDRTAPVLRVVPAPLEEKLRPAA